MKAFTVSSKFKKALITVGSALTLIAVTLTAFNHSPVFAQWSANQAFTMEASVADLTPQGETETVLEDTTTQGDSSLLSSDGESDDVTDDDGGFTSSSIKDETDETVEPPTSSIKDENGDETVPTLVPSVSSNVGGEDVIAPPETAGLMSSP